MGCKLGKLLEPEIISFDKLKRKFITVDGTNFLIRHISKLAIFDNKLKQNNNDPVSHYLGLFYFVVNLLEKKIKPVFVFDGIPLQEKRKIPEERNQKIIENWKNYQKSYNDRTINKKYLHDYYFLFEKAVIESIELIRSLGISAIRAPSEAEAQAARIVKDGYAYGVLSHDYDTLLFGSKIMLKDIDFEKNTIIKINLNKNLQKLGINYAQLIDLACLIGTDFNKKEIKGIGPKKALKLIKEHGNLENIDEHIIKLNLDMKRIRAIFYNPITIRYRPYFTRPNYELLKRVVLKHKLNPKRIENGIARLKRAFDEINIEQKTVSAFIQ